MSGTHKVALTVDERVDRVDAPAQDSLTQRALWEAEHAQKRAKRRAQKKAAQKHFSEKLCAAMTQAGLSASQLARRIWGEEKTRRGTTAAKNRDRVGLFMKGLAYPQPETMKKLADGIGIPVEELVPPRPRERQPRVGVARKPAATAQTATARQPLLSINMLPGTQHARLQMDQVVPMELAIDIAQRINALTASASTSTSTAATPPQLGTVVK
jgi:transcriptional regulator with XRE-family HTH domain